MKTFLTLGISCLSCYVSIADEYVSRSQFGARGRYVVVRHFFFNGDECYGAKRISWDKMMHVVFPKTIWELYYGGELLATIDPQTGAMEYIKVPAGMEFSKVRTSPKAPFDDPESLSGFKLANDEKILRIWNLSKNGLRFLSQDVLESIEARDSKVPDTKIYAPTKKEAVATMLKVIDGVPPNLAEVPLLNSTSASPPTIEEANKPAQIDGDKPSN